MVRISSAASTKCDNQGTRANTHVVLLLGGNGIDEIIFSHEQLPCLLIFVRMVVEVGFDLVGHLVFVCFAHQGLLDSVFDTGHGVAKLEREGERVQEPAN